MLTVLILMLYVHCTLYFIFLILLWLQCQPVIIIFEGFFIFIQVPKKRNKFKLLDSGCELTTQMIIERIISHRYEIVDHKTPIQAHFTAQKLILIIRVPSYYLLKIAAMKFLSIKHLVSFDQYQCRDATHDSLLSPLLNFDTFAQKWFKSNRID